MAIKKIYKIIKPQSATALVPDNHDISGGSLGYSNQSWYNKLVQGSANRMTRYKELDQMDNDIDVARALDIITQEICGNSTKHHLPIDFVITSGNEQQLSSVIPLTLRAALKTWCYAQDWETRLPKLVRSTLKYGDCFLLRPKEKNKYKLKYLHPRSIVSAITDIDDVTIVRGWQVQLDNHASGNIGMSNLASTNPQMLGIVVPKDDMIVFSNNDETSDSAPFGLSIFNDVFTTFKQKEAIEVALIIYRIQRAPEKRVFYIDMNNVPVHKRSIFLENAKAEIKQKKIPSLQGGKSAVDSIYNPSSMSEDFYIPTTKDSNSRIEVLAGGQNLGNLEDLQYFYQKIWRGLRIPQSYIDNTTEGGSAFNDGKVGIAYMQEIKFTIYVQQLQKIFERVLDAEFKRFLYDNKITIDPTIFKIILPEPSNFTKSRQQTIDESLISNYMNIKDDDNLSPRFKFVKYLQLTQEDILLNERLKAEELGLDPNNTYKNLAKIYNSGADDGGFDGGLGASGFSGDVGAGAGDVDLDMDNDAESTDSTDETEKTDKKQTNK